MHLLASPNGMLMLSSDSFEMPVLETDNRNTKKGVAHDCSTDEYGPGEVRGDAGV